MSEFQQNQNEEEKPENIQDGVKLPESDELTIITERAKHGDPEAQYRLGMMYIHGRDIEQNLIKGVEWLEKAAEKEHIEAQFVLGEIYLGGIDVKGKVIIKQNYSEALKWLQKATEQGHYGAQFYLNCAVSAKRIGIREQEIKNVILEKYVGLHYAIKFEKMNEFDKSFSKFLKEAYENGNFEIIEQRFRELPFTKPINMEMLRAISRINDESTFRIQDDIILEDMDWSNSGEVFKYLSFNEKTFSKTSKEHLPAGYDSQEVFELGKTIGLGIDEVHKKIGFTGKGIRVAIIDVPLAPHDDIETKENHSPEFDNSLKPGSGPGFFHASATTGIFVGKETGVAPDAETYFFAEFQDKSENNNEGCYDIINALQAIININETSSDNEKIRVISISGSIYSSQKTTPKLKDEISKLVEKLTNTGVWIISADNFWDNFGYLEKKDPTGDPNNFNNYQISNGEWVENALYVNSGDRTVPYPSNETAYRHDSRASESWAIPVVAGYYALACQADPRMTPQRFIKLAHDTAQVRESTWNIYEDGSSIPTGRSQETMPIQIIDIKALIDEIIKEKNG